MSQPSSHPHHVSQLLGPALGGIIHALADRGEQTDGDYEARADEAWRLVRSFQPRDPIDLMLTGQFITMNELFADTAGDILRGMADGVKQRARSSAVAMGRLALAQVAEFERRGMQPYRTESATEQRPVAAAKAAIAEPVKQPQPAAATPQPGLPEEAFPVEETSWVDEPYQEYLEETPAMLAASATMVAAKDGQPEVTHEANVSAGASSGLELPGQRTAHPRAEAMHAAAD